MPTSRKVKRANGAAIAFGLAALIVAACGIFLVMSGTLERFVSSFDAKATTNGFAVDANSEVFTARVSQDIPNLQTTLQEAIEEAERMSNPELLLANYASYTPTAEDLNALSGSSEVFAFAFNTASSDEAPMLSSESAAALTSSLASFEENGYEAGFVLLDMGSGRGIAANIDERVYGASSFKGPFVLFVCETKIDTGAATSQTLCSEGIAASYLAEDLAGDGRTSYELGTLIENSIIYSSNDSFRILRANFDSTLGTWLSGIGIDSAIADDTWFPHYSARESALLWLHMNDYLNSGASCAQWLSGLLGSTEKSFIRTAITREEGEAATSLVILNKAGWISSSEERYCGTCDAGLITKDGRTWLLSVMTSAPDSETYEARTETLIQTLWNARGDLASASSS